MAAAVLAGGPGARLCDATAGWWMQLLATPPSVIFVATRHKRPDLDGIVWRHSRLRDDEVGHYKRMPVTSPARTALDLAAHLPLWDLKQVLAELEYHHGIEAPSLDTVLRRGHPGTTKLRRAIAQHTPELAETRSHLERAFVRFSVERGLELPLFNHPVGRSTVDAVYARIGLVVELDGVRGHSGERRILRDHRRDLHRRAEGKQVRRYHYTQILHDGDLVEADLLSAGVQRNALPSPR